MALESTLVLAALAWLLCVLGMQDAGWSELQGPALPFAVAAAQLGTGATWHMTLQFGLRHLDAAALTVIERGDILLPGASETRDL
jgi:hypothetical protein